MVDPTSETDRSALRLDPRTRIGRSMSVLGGARFLARRFNEAVPNLLLAIQDDPINVAPYRWLAACYAHLGRLDDAREIIERLRAIPPVVMPDARQLRDLEQRELLLSGLRMAMGERT